MRQETRLSSVAFRWWRAGWGRGGCRREQRRWKEENQKGEGDNGGTGGEITTVYPHFGVIPYWLFRQLPSRQDSLLQQNVPHRCGDGGISREDGWKEQQRDPFSPGPHPFSLPFSPRVVLAVFIVPSQSTQVYLERELDTFTVHHHNWNTGLSRVRLDNRTEHKLGMHTKHVWVYLNSGFILSGLQYSESVIWINNRKWP